jgi:hypothetical protein
MDRKLLFYGGIFGPIVFLLNDIIGSIITQGYSPIINAVSELTQAGSENIYLGEWGTGAIPGAVYLTVISSFLILSLFEISNFSSVLSYVLPFCLLCTSDHLILFN